MTILQLVTARQFRGAEVAAASFSRAMLERGHKVIFVGIRKPSNPPLEIRGATCVDLNTSGGGMFLPAFLRLKALIDRERPDILHANGSITLTYLVLARFFYRRARLGYRNISMVSHWKGSGLKHALIKWIIAQTDFVTSVGEAARQDFISTYDYPSDKIQVVRRGIPLPRKTGDRLQARTRLGIHPDAHVLLSVGNFSFEKGHDILLERFAAIRGQLPDAQLLLVGEGELKENLESRAERLGLKPAVTFAGLQPDLTDYFAAADLLVLTSRVEGVPGVVLEAGAHQVPSVATDVGGVNESIRDGQTGYLIRPDDHEAFVKSVVKLLSDADTRRQFGRAAFEWTSENFDVEKNTDRLIAILEAL